METNKQQTPGNLQPQVQPGKKSNTLKIVAIVLVIAVILVIGIIFAVRTVFKSTSEELSGDTTNSQRSCASVDIEPIYCIVGLTEGISRIDIEITGDAPHQVVGTIEDGSGETKTKNIDGSEDVVYLESFGTEPFTASIQAILLDNEGETVTCGSSEKIPCEVIQ